MDFVDHFDLQREKITRSSLACLPCRLRHLKCDGAKPRCARCSVADVQCRYTKSRRGGLDRQTLHKRRKQLTPESFASHQRSRDVLSVHSEASDQLDLSAPLPLDREIGPRQPAPSVIHHLEIEKDHLIDQYYQSFHDLHPFVLPRKELARLCRSQERWPKLIPLVTSMRLIGDLYTQCWSETIHLACEGYARLPVANGFTVQFYLLYSIALFWSGFRTEAISKHRSAARLALDIDMHRRDFASDQGNGDPVLQESWRRTWWSLFVVDAYYAGTLGTMSFSVLDVEATVDLPCEEIDYHNGTIPEPRTLAEFDCREFAAEDQTFSSFAYLIAAVRCAGLATSIAINGNVQDLSTKIIQEADSVIDGWLLLLPKASKQVMSKTGKIDELLFQAHLVVHVASIGLHRPLSDLMFNATENISSCAREPAISAPTPDFINVHTVRVLRAVKEQIGLLALPARPFVHSPFVTCMVSEGTLALLSACKFLLNGKQLAIGRDQIRMTIGCLSSLAEVWSGTAKNLQEIKTIARHVFVIESTENQTPSTNQVPSLADDSGRSRLESENGLGSVDLLQDDMDIIGRWTNITDIDTTAWLDDLFQIQ